MNPVVTDVPATFTKLDKIGGQHLSGWGARVKATEDLAGRDVILTTKKGQEVRKALGRFVAQFGEFAIYTFADEKQQTLSVAATLPQELSQRIVDALDSEEEDAVYSALMEVATLFNLR